MKLAHVRERHAPSGTPWRLVAALGAGERPEHWLHLELARRRAVAVLPGRAHNEALYRRVLTTLDDALADGLRVEALRPLVEEFAPRAEDDEAVLTGADLVFGPPILRPPGLRDYYAFEGHVRTMWERRGGEVPEAWYRLPVFYFSNTSELRGPDEPVHAPAGSSELDYELEVAALVDTPVRDVSAERAEEAIGGFTIFNDWSARDLQRDETSVRLGPAKGKDFASTIGPWLVTPDELADVRSATGFELTMTAEVNETETSRGRWSASQYSFGEMLARAAADVRVRPGELLGSGTVGGGSLLEIRETTLGRYLEPGDEVVLRVERLGALRTPIVARPDAPVTP